MPLGFPKAKLLAERKRLFLVEKSDSACAQRLGKKVCFEPVAKVLNRWERAAMNKKAKTKPFAVMQAVWRRVKRPSFRTMLRINNNIAINSRKAA